MTYLVAVLYIIAFSMFIYGLMGLTGPKTAVRGNWIAAAGMALAVIATLVYIRDTENWGLIPRQDFSNIERQQRGLHSLSFTELRLATEWERAISNMHEELDRYLAR